MGLDVLLGVHPEETMFDSLDILDSERPDILKAKICAAQKKQTPQAEPNPTRTLNPEQCTSVRIWPRNLLVLEPVSLTPKYT